MATAAVASSSKHTMDQTNTPAWGSYLYQNFLLPAFSPNIASQWLTSPFGLSTHETSNNGNNGNNGNHEDYSAQPPAPPGDYFGSSWHVKNEPGLPQPPPPMNNAQSYQTQPPTYSQSQTPSSWSFFGGIPTSLLTANQQQQQQQPMQDIKPNPYAYNTYNNSLNANASGSRPAKISPVSVDAVDELVASPSPMLSSRNSPHHSPKKGKRRALSMDSNEDQYENEQDHEVPEGVERDGMIWGMRVEEYRALSARERKRVRNRISARTFRAKRKGEFCSPRILLRSC